MQQLIFAIRGVSSPGILIVVTWCGILIGVAIGPIDYPGQPSAVAATMIAAGIALFLLGDRAGQFVFNRWFARQVEMTAFSARALNRVVLATSLIGIGGIGLIAVDRTMLSGVGYIAYSELLRCAPSLVDAIAIKRTPLLYLGYMTFSFSFGSLSLFLLKGEEIRGWAAALAQLSLISPVGYALLYSGRMPILLVLVLVLVVMLVRASQSRRPLPGGHHLLLKAAVIAGLFAVYSSSIWTSRQNFCAEISPLIHELEQRKEALQAENGTVITATDLSRKVAELRAATGSASNTISADALLAIMLEAWNVKPRTYVTSAIESGHVSPHAALIGLSTYFYLTHGVRVVDIVWHQRDNFSPQWGVYEIGVLSPILRVFFPGSQQLSIMEAELKSAGIYGFFPTVWGAAFVDFGIVGATIYLLIWGGLAGWSAAASRRSSSMTPLLLLVFLLTSILLSPIQGPLGIANSALVLLSMLVTGLAVDVLRRRASSPREAHDVQQPAT